MEKGKHETEVVQGRERGDERKKKGTREREKAKGRKGCWPAVVWTVGKSWFELGERSWIRERGGKPKSGGGPTNERDATTDGGERERLSLDRLSDGLSWRGVELLETVCMKEKRGNERVRWRFESDKGGREEKSERNKTHLFLFDLVISFLSAGPSRGFRSSKAQRRSSVTLMTAA